MSLIRTHGMSIADVRGKVPEVTSPWRNTNEPGPDHIFTEIWYDGPLTGMVSHQGEYLWYEAFDADDNSVGNYFCLVRLPEDVLEKAMSEYRDWIKQNPTDNYPIYCCEHVETFGYPVVGWFKD